MGLLRATLGLSFLLVSCTSATHTALAPLSGRMSDPKKVTIFWAAPPRKARPIAMVSVARDGENATWAVEVLKMEAAELGADAITYLDINYSTGFFPTMRVQGIAVKYE